MAKIINYEHSFVVEDRTRTEHQKGSVYSDIKRGNLLIYSYGNPRSPIHTIPLKEITEPNATTTKELREMLRAFFFRPVITSSVPIFTGGFVDQQAYRLNGVDTYINLYQPPSLDFKPDQEFTIITWVKLNRTNNCVFLGKARGSNRQFMIELNNRRPRFYVGNRERSLGNTLSNNRWYMLTLRNRNDNGTFRFDCFIDANKLGSNTSGTWTNNLDIFIGARRRNSDNSGFERVVNGEMDETLFYKAALQDINIAELYGGGNFKNPSLVAHFENLVSWYRADKDKESFPIVTDRKGNNNGAFINATLQNIVTK